MTDYTDQASKKEDSNSAEKSTNNKSAGTFPKSDEKWKREVSKFKDEVEKPKQRGENNRIKQGRKFSSNKAKIKYILQPLEDVVLNPALLDEIIVKYSIPELLQGKEPSYSGAILFGPPGTGKTVLQKALGEVYSRAEAYSTDKSFAQINSHFVNDFAQNLEKVLEVALVEAKKRKKPSFVSFDEASILVQAAEEGAETFSKGYQEAIDILKRYIGNYRELVLSVSTNLSPDSFEEALTREGRLATFFIDYPKVEERARLWQHFLGKYKVLDNLNGQQFLTLAEITPAEQGAFIEEFCRNYKGHVRTELLKSKGYFTLIDALKNRANISMKEVGEAINYNSLVKDVDAFVQRKLDKNITTEKQKQIKGF